VNLNNKGIRKGLILSAATGLAIGAAGVAGVGAASAATGVQAAATKSLTYNCNYPLIGSRQVKIDIDTNVPSKLGVGQYTNDIQIKFKATLGADTTDGLKAIGGSTIVGGAAAKAAVQGPGQNITVNVNNAFGETKIPDSGAFTLDGYGEAPAVGFDQAGHVTAALTAMEFTVLVKKGDGSPAALGEFKAPCTLADGQDATIVSADIVQGNQPLGDPWQKPAYFPYKATGAKPGTLNYGFNLSGSSYIKGPNGTVPLNGGINVAVDGGTGAIAGQLSLQKTKGMMSILGFLPVEATVDFQQVGDTVGTFANGQIKTTSTMYIKLPSFTLFGIPLGGGDQCRAKDPSKIQMQSNDGVFFNPLVGGPFKAANYSIAELENCGLINGILSIFASQSGNTIDLKLSPKA
jgi:hypothetical protein